MIDFIFGSAGSGKSTYIYDWLNHEATAHPEQAYYLFVPEQNTLKAQREIVERGERHGMLNLDVLSFQLCAYRVLEELGITPPTLMDDVTKSILIRKTVLELANDLMVYKRKSNSAGFINQIKNLISEFLQYDVDVERLRAVGENADIPLLRGKIADVCSIYEGFRAKLSDKAAIPEDIAYSLLDHIAQSELLKNAVIVFDGYTGFTPIQLRILEHIIPMAAQVRFSVTIPFEADPYRRIGSDHMTDMYWLSRETVAKVCEIAEKNGIPNTGEHICRGKKNQAEVRILSCEDPTEEARMIARDIHLSAVRDGYRYKRIAVAAADPDGYRELIKRELQGEEIPFFIDDRSDSVGNPAVEYIRGALAVIGSHFRYDEVMTFVKNPLHSICAEARENADLLDNYIRKNGIRGRKAYEALFGCDEEKGHLGEQIAEFDFAELFTLEDKLKNCESIAEITAALADFLQRVDLKKRSDDFADRIDQEGMLKNAVEIRRILDLIPGFFERLHHILGEEKCSLMEYAKLVDAGFRDMKGGIIPETMDMVIIGDLKRSRFDDIDLLYVIGANDGLIPSTVTGGGIFTDYERIAIQNANITMAPDDRTDSCIQKFYLNLILNKPAKRLTVLYSRTGRDGRLLKPSSVIHELENGIYGEFSSFSEEYADLSESVSSVKDAVMDLALAGEKNKVGTPRYYALLQALKKNGSYIDLDHILNAAGLIHGKDRLSEEIAAQLYHEVLDGSVTRIENYEGCAFYHYAKHGLDLREREEHGIEAVDIGNLFHSVLDKVFRFLKEKDVELQHIDDRELIELCDHAIDSIVTEYNNKVFVDSAKSKYITEKLRKISYRTIRTLKEHLLHGTFTAQATEKKFNYREDNLNLHGVIDRVDCYEHDEDTFVKIIDYKSGKKDFSLSRVADGLDLQLVTYLDSAMKDIAAEKGSSEHIIPAGMFYYHIDDPVIRYNKKMMGSEIETVRENELKMHGAITEDAEAASYIDKSLLETEEGRIDHKVLKNSLVMKGNSEVLSREDFLNLIRFSNQKMKEDTQKILKGDIHIQPYRDGSSGKCDYCPYHSVCRFDIGIEGFQYRNIRKHDRDSVLEMIRSAGKTAEEDNDV